MKTDAFKSGYTSNANFLCMLFDPYVIVTGILMRSQK